RCLLVAWCFRKWVIALNLAQIRGTGELCARIAACLALDIAWSYRAACNQAEWLTEVGRLHPTYGDGLLKTPLYAQRPKNGKCKRIILQNLWVDRLRSSGQSEEHTSELQSRSDLVCRLLLEKKKKQI